MRGALIGLAALGLAASGLAGCGQSDDAAGGGAGAAGEKPPANFDEAVAGALDAAAKFAQLAKGSEASGQAPRATDGAAGPLIDAVFNTASLPTGPLNDDQLGEVNNWLGAVNQVGATYMLAGTGVTDITAASPAVSEQVGHNLITFAPELGRYYDAELALAGAEAAALAQQVAANPGRFDAKSNPTAADGLTRVRAGLAQTAAGVITTISGPGPTDAWREARGKALDGFAANAASLFTAGQRGELQAQATSAAAVEADPSVKTELEAFASAMGK